MKLLSVKKSTQPEKKYMAVFELANGEKKTTHFGATGYSDFRQHRSEMRKQAYLKRHRRNENWEDPTSAGSLSRYLLWSEPTLEQAISKFKQKFNL
jgi:hypothetical protein